MSNDKLKHVLEHKGHHISLDVSTGKFAVDGLDCGDLASLQEAKKAVDRATKAMLDVKRRPVIVLEERYSYRNEEDLWIFGELTSFSSHRWERANLHANIVKNKERTEHDTDDVYEDTPANRECVKRVVEIGKQLSALTEERERILKKVMARVAVPNLREEA